MSRILCRAHFVDELNALRIGPSGPKIKRSDSDVREPIPASRKACASSNEQERPARRQVANEGLRAISIRNR